MSTDNDNKHLFKVYATTGNEEQLKDIDGNLVGVGIGYNKILAEQEAARNILIYYGVIQNELFDEDDDENIDITES